MTVEQILHRGRERARQENVSGAVFLVALSVLFFLAGRSLAVAGSTRGFAWPWIAVSAMTTLPFFFVQRFLIPTPSMADTLLIGDRILVQRFPKPRAESGDMIIFVYPIDRSEAHVSRVIGVPGDEIHILNKVVY